MRFLAGNPPFFGRLRESHIRTIDAKNAAAIHGAFETTQGAIDGFAVSNFDSYGQNYSPYDSVGWVNRFLRQSHKTIVLHRVFLYHDTSSFHEEPG